MIMSRYSTHSAEAGPPFGVLGLLGCPHSVITTPRVGLGQVAAVQSSLAEQHPVLLGSGTLLTPPGDCP